MPRQASPTPRTASVNCQKASGTSGLPKFRQSVIAAGSPPTQATLRQASSTARGAGGPGVGQAQQRVAVGAQGHGAAAARHRRDHAGVGLARAQDGAACTSES